MTSGVVASTLVSEARSKIVSSVVAAASSAKVRRPNGRRQSIRLAVPTSTTAAGKARAATARSRTSRAPANSDDIPRRLLRSCRGRRVRAGHRCGHSVDECLVGGEQSSGSSLVGEGVHEAVVEPRLPVLQMVVECAPGTGEHTGADHGIRPDRSNGSADLRDQGRHAGGAEPAPFVGQLRGIAEGIDGLDLVETGACRGVEGWAAVVSEGILGPPVVVEVGTREAKTFEVDAIERK